MNYRQQINFNNSYFSEQAAWLVDTFQNSNVIVFGKKGSGKDVLFATVIHLLDGLHYANMPYNPKTLVLKSLRALGVGGNTYKDIVNGTITKYADPFIPGLPIFISDGAVYFGTASLSGGPGLAASLLVTDLVTGIAFFNFLMSFCILF